MKADGLPTFRSRVAAAAPFLARSLEALTDWDQVKLLSVRANRLRQWWLPGLLCIGDAAHAMSPVGGIGVNYAIADAVAAANSLAGPLQNGRVVDDHLRAVQKRRQTPEGGPISAGCADSESRPIEQDRSPVVDIAFVDPFRAGQTAIGPDNGAWFPPRTHPQWPALTRRAPCLLRPPPDISAKVTAGQPD